MLLRSDMKVLEYGSGGSSTLFSKWVDKWVSIEHDRCGANPLYLELNESNWLLRWWGQKVKSMIKEMKLESKVSVYIVPNNKKYDQKRHGDGDEIQFRSYINFAAQLNTTFDLVLDDGRARVPVRFVGLRNTNL